MNPFAEDTITRGIAETSPYFPPSLGYQRFKIGRCVVIDTPGIVARQIYVEEDFETTIKGDETDISNTDSLACMTWRLA
jgi:hypothetical protein